MPSLVRAETGTAGDVAAVLLDQRRRARSSCCFTRSGFGAGRSILLIATMIGTPAALGVVDRLDRLRHDAVVGGDDEDGDVGHLRAARAHRGEGLVAGRVEEGDLAGR